MTGHKYTSKLCDKKDNAFRVIADHLRSVSFAIADGVTPSNEGRGYVIRRILRRAGRFGRVLDAHEPFMFRLVDILSDVMGDAFGEIKERADFVRTVIESEEASFGRTLDRGLEIFASAAKSADEGVIKGEDAFALYDTYGFPLDLTELMARERGLKVDTAEFERLMEEQRAMGRAAQRSGSLVAALGGMKLPATDDSQKYEADSCGGKVLCIVSKDGVQSEGGFDDSSKEVGLVLDKTCFYAEAGGQVGDGGMIKGAGFELSRLGFDPPGVGYYRRFSGLADSS